MLVIFLLFFFKVGYPVYCSRVYFALRITLLISASSHFSHAQSDAAGWQKKKIDLMVKITLDIIYFQ